MTLVAVSISAGSVGPIMAGVGSTRVAATPGSNVVASCYWGLLRRWGVCAPRCDHPYPRGGLLNAEGASDGRVEVVPPCCDLAVGNFEDTHDRHRYLDTVLTA